MKDLRCSYTTRMAWRELNRWLLVWTPFSAVHGIRPSKPTHRDPTPSSGHQSSARPNPLINHKPQTKRTTYARAKLDWVISKYQTVTDIKRIHHLPKPTAGTASFKKPEQKAGHPSLPPYPTASVIIKKQQLQKEETAQTPSNSSQNPVSPFSKQRTRVYLLLKDALMRPNG